uniref:HD domain-containing protein n=1 Tax=Auxenochlorella protothecoides TaxID=3075 RepID=A0A1D1ZWX0_AUXPR
MTGLVGDITPTCGVSDEEKHALESAGIQKLKAMLGGGPAADEMEELWREYEAGESTEAALVKDFDKLEMILQAQEYEAGQGMVLQEFFDSTAGKWRTGLGRAWAAEIASRRPGAAAQED